MTEVKKSAKTVSSINFFTKESESDGPNKEVIRLSKAKDSAKNSSPLYKTFTALINGKEISVPPAVATHILRNDLDINYDNLSAVLKRVLPDSLIYFMMVWPGWKNSPEYFKGTLVFSEYFHKFTAYLKFHTKYVIDNEKKFHKADDAGKGVNAETMTDESNSDTSDVVMEISGPPDGLNSIVFFENDSNIVLRQFVARKAWVDLTFKQLLNWPSFSVTLCLENLIFTRSNVHEYSRFISLLGEAKDVAPEIDAVSYIKPTKEKVIHSIYDLNYLHYYINQFASVASQIYGLDNTNVSDVTNVMLEFMEDLNEVNIYKGSMATLTTVCFNIGKFKYIRNKKVVSKNATNPRAVNFYEILTPKVEFTLHHFNPVQDTTTEQITYKNLNETLERFLQTGNSGNLINNTCITYNCTFCNFKWVGFNGKLEILLHFQLVHKAEQAVLCFKCRQEFDILYLAENRWSHVCKT